MLSPGNEQVLEHYKHFWGEPKQLFFSDRNNVSPPGPIIVAEFRSDDKTPIWTYATIGVSRYPMPYPPNWRHDKSDKRIELLMYAYQPMQELVDLLGGLALYPFSQRTFLGVGHTIPGPRGGAVVEGSPLTDILLIPALTEPKEFRILHIDQDHHIELLWVVPIYNSERLFVKEHGWGKLVELFSDKEVNAKDFTRLPVVGSTLL